MAFRVVQETVRFLAVSDPGRLRLRAATATTITVILAMVVLLPGSNLIGQPLTVALLGTVVAMQSSAAVKDRDQHSRVITTLLLVFPALAAVSMSAVLSQFGKVADVGFIAVLFAAVWVRRYGREGRLSGWSRSSATSSHSSFGPSLGRFPSSPCPSSPASVSRSSSVP